MTAAVQQDESGTDLRLAVAEEIRSWLGRRRISGAALARRLGKSQTWVARRLDGRQAFDVDDLQLVAGILQVPVVTFFSSSASAATGATTRELLPPSRPGRPALFLVSDSPSRYPDVAGSYGSSPQRRGNVNGTDVARAAGTVNDAHSA